MSRSLYSLLLWGWVLLGCASAPYSHSSIETSREKLTHLLRELSPKAPREEVYRLAHDVVRRSEALNRKFERTDSPWVHNFLVNVGLKSEGLCYHFSDGLYTYLRQGDYPHFTFHLVGANIGEYWREHNALVITAKGGDVYEGIVVDPWRKTGGVFVSKLKDDKAYAWRHRPLRGCKRVK